MDAFEIVRQLKARRQTILANLPVDLLAELEEIDATIREIDAVLLKRSYPVNIGVPVKFAHMIDPQAAPASRVPKAQSREKLRTYLKIHGVASRQEIVLGTGIPVGTLTSLLAESEFESPEHGHWRLKPEPEPKCSEE